MNIVSRATICLVGLLMTLAAPRAISQAPPGQDTVNAAVVARVARSLAGRKVAAPPARTRGQDLSALYRSSVLNVPVVLSQSGLGSSIVIGGKKNGHFLVITNNHVIERPITIEERSVVLLIFYDPTLKNELFNPDRFSQCFSSDADKTDWCKAVRRSTRIAAILRADPAHDLALLQVDNVPAGVTGLQPASINALQPGDQVAVIGHPTGLLWSMTTGIISAVRTHMMIGNAFGTVIQTQTAVNPGNSGGPLIGTDGNVAGVIFGSRAGQTFKIGSEDVTMPTEGLNYAIGIDTALAFTSDGDK
jgi:S1-C subfamily serine protease